jgi:hypothetical protein
MRREAPSLLPQAVGAARNERSRLGNVTPWLRTRFHPFQELGTGNSQPRNFPEYALFPRSVEILSSPLASTESNNC